MLSFLSGSHAGKLWKHQLLLEARKLEVGGNNKLDKILDSLVPCCFVLQVQWEILKVSMAIQSCVPLFTTCITQVLKQSICIGQEAK